MAFNIKSYKSKKKAPPSIEEPLLGIVNGFGEVRIEFERGKFHHTIFGPIATAKARARFRYDPKTQTVTWTDRDDAKDADIFYAVVNAIESRGGIIARHSTLGGGVMRSTPDEVLAFNLNRFLKTATMRVAIVSPETARKIQVKKELPIHPKFEEAVNNTEGASISEDGLAMSVFRQQHPDQGERRSLRDGVFYQPTGSPSKYPFTGKNGYGGSERIDGRTVFKKPLFVKGAVGGKAPITAYDIIKGKGAFQKMREKVLKLIVYDYRPKSFFEISSTIEKLFDEFGGGEKDAAEEIAEYGLTAKGNGLVYAIQENIISNTVRNAGYDSIIGWSQRKDGTAFISEIFDLRERTYPSKFKPEGELHQSFLGNRSP